ncbi:MAG: Dps family protein [Alphaproteobacteria bacterium]
MINKSLVDKLKVVLANSYALYLKTHNYHWNVVAPNFRELHLMFEDQYTDLATAVDEIAERIRMLGSKAPGTFKTYDALKTIADGNENADANTMLKDLTNDQILIVQSLKAALKEAQAIGDEVTIGLLVNRITIHEKNAWFMKSSI